MTDLVTALPKLLWCKLLNSHAAMRLHAVIRKARFLNPVVQGAHVSPFVGIMIEALSKRVFQRLNVFCNDLDSLEYMTFLELLYLWYQWILRRLSVDKAKCVT